MNEYIEANRKHWNEVAPIHTGAISYDVPGFKAGKSSLNSVEREEVGDVQGKTLLHLQCQFGLDTLCWAREGAVVTGIDFSESAINQARELAKECGIASRFLVSDVYDLPDNLDGQFDIVFTSGGVLWWLPDLTRWAQIASSFVRPGGTFYIAEFHPFASVFDDAPDVDDLYVKYPYFSTPDQPLRFDKEHAYALRSVELVSREAEHVDFERLHVQALPACRLDRVGMERDGPIELLRPGMDEAPDRRDVLHGADLVVGVHHTDYGRVVRDRRRDGLRVKQATLIDGKEGHLVARP